MNPQGNKTSSPYKTLIIGKLIQRSGLTVSGSGHGNTSSCYRDGNGRLVLPSTGLTGLLVETAARACPSVIDDEKGDFQVTGKGMRLTRKLADEKLRQSLWSAYSSYLLNDDLVKTYWQQGVGINQKTRTSANKELNALYEQECVPAGAQWTFFLEIDTAVSHNAQWLAIVALQQWCGCLLYTSPSPRDRTRSRMPSSA